MRTAVGAAEPPERDTSTLAHAVIMHATAIGVTVTPWQAVVIHQAFASRATQRRAWDAEFPSTQRGYTCDEAHSDEAQ